MVFVSAAETAAVGLAAVTTALPACVGSVGSRAMPPLKVAAESPASPAAGLSIPTAYTAGTSRPSSWVRVGRKLL